MQFLGSLGVDIWLLIAQVINFLVLLWLLSKLVYRPLLARMEADERILQSVKKAEAKLDKKEKELERKEKRYETRTKNKAREIIHEAETIAKDIEKTARQETAVEKEAVLQQIDKRLKEIVHE